MIGRPLKIAVAVLRDSTAFVPIGVAELLGKALQLAVTLPGPPARAAQVMLVGEQRRVTAAGGRPVQCDATFDQVRRCDLAIVPALDPDVLEHLSWNAAAVRWARRVHGAGAVVASACTGAFVLAEAGLLAGRRATTHWAFQPLLGQRYPDVRVEPQAILVDQGQVCTAGGATSFIQLALYLVERFFGPEVASVSSKMFLIDVNKAPQGTYAIFSTQRQHADEAILRAQDLIEQRSGAVGSLDELARAVAMSPRTFARRFKRATGNTAREYVQRVRIEAARRLLEGGRQPLQSIAARVGYGDPVAFRKMFVRITGLTPADYRRRHGQLTGPESAAIVGRIASVRGRRAS